MKKLTQIAKGLDAAMQELVAPRPRRFTAEGKRVVCPKCGGDSFRKEAPANPGASAPRRMWPQPAGCVLICAQCAHAQAFEVDLTAEDA